MSDSDLCYLSATRAIELFKSHDLSPVDLMQAVIKQAERVNPSINAFTHQFFDEALAQAKKAEQRYMNGRARALEGIPLVVKDETAIKGFNTTRGSLISRDNIDDYTAPVIDRVLRAGAIVHGRSNAPEFSCAAVCHSRLYGVTRNPWNTDYTPGGSSGGAAAQLAAGTTTLANGSDIGGSIRIPAGCCGVVGYKPPYGRVPEFPPFNLDYYCHEGPLARTVDDCALFENVIAGPHPQDMVSIRPKLNIPQQLKPIKGFKIAYSIDLSYVEVDDEVRRNTLATLDVFESLGAEICEVDLGWSSQTLAAAMAHLSHLFGTTIAENLTRDRYELTSYALAFAEMSRHSSAKDFITAMDVANEMYASFGAIMQKHNLFVCPTNALPAAKADHDPKDGKIVINDVSVDPMLGWVMTYPFNMLSRCPVMSVPSGFSKNHVPTGVQLVGRTYDDVSVFRAAADLERAKPWLDCKARRPILA